MQENVGASEAVFQAVQGAPKKREGRMRKGMNSPPDFKRLQVRTFLEIVRKIWHNVCKFL